ncbi:hypothetical protein CbuG_1443 [Coxiella burnetii CbuG_Q212]|nr:hypothetical protein CbuG_1443 [Coxiella burnetii CbuG_Q212]
MDFKQVRVKGRARLKVAVSTSSPYERSEIREQ